MTQVMPVSKCMQIRVSGEIRGISIKLYRISFVIKYFNFNTMNFDYFQLIKKDFYATINA